MTLVDDLAATVRVPSLTGNEKPVLELLAERGEALGLRAELREEVAGYTLEWFDVEASSRRPPHATVCVRSPDGQELQGSFTGDGPVDAIFRAINVATGVDAQLREFRVDAVTGGQDALGEVSVIIELDGQSASGQGVATDILEAAGIAYVRALGTAVRRAQMAARQDEDPALAPTP